MVAFGKILIVFIFVLDYTYSVSRPQITDLGDLNFLASWEPVENYTGMYNLIGITRQRKNLCYTNATSCFLGGKLLEDEDCPFIKGIGITLEADGTEPRSNYFLNNIFRVGPPNVQSLEIESTETVIEVQGGQTPLYFDAAEEKFRGASWTGEKSPIFMGQWETKRVSCKYNLTNSSGLNASHEVKYFSGELGSSDGKLAFLLEKLKPFSSYSISVWCSLNRHDSRITVYNFTTKQDYTYSVSRPQITDLGNLNFLASWEPLENYTGMYNLTGMTRQRKNLCYTNATSCFLGGKLLENEDSPFIKGIAITLEADGGEPGRNYVLNNIFRVGPPNVQSLEIESTSTTIEVQGGRTPLYVDRAEEKFRGASWTGEKSPIFMGQWETRRVLCKYNLTDSSGLNASHEVKYFSGELGNSEGKLQIFLKKLKPFSSYSISVWCNLNRHDSRITVYNFTTKEDVPSGGPTVEKLSSEGLGCDKPDLRNITFTIRPPPEEQRHGILQFYEIHYRHIRVINCNYDERWQTEIVDLPSPLPAFTEVLLDNLFRWDAYEVKVFANNSVGGMPSSVHLFEVHKPRLLQSRPQNMTAKEIQEDVWLLSWDQQWSPHIGDCIINYVVSTGEKPLGMTSTTSYILDRNAVGPVTTVKITPMIYNGSWSTFKGLPALLSLSPPSSSPPSPSPLSSSHPNQEVNITLSILLAVFIVCLFVCGYLYVHHCPCWTQPFDISNNPVLKAAFAMPDIQPRIQEREVFDTLVGIPPPHPPPPPFADDGDHETETVALIETLPAGRAGGDALPCPPIPDHSPPHSTEGSLSEECSPVVAMETHGDNGSVASSSACSLNDDSSGEMMSGYVPSIGSDLNTSCSEVSLSPPPRYPSLTDSGYVQSPPPQMLPIPNQAKPAEDSGYFRFDALANVPCKVVIDPGKHPPGGDVNERRCGDIAMSSPFKYTDSGYVAGTMIPMSSASTYPETAHLSSKYYVMKPARKQSSIDSEDTATSGSLSPSDSEMGDGVGSYTKFSYPNTPLSSRSKEKPGDELQGGWDLEEDFSSIQLLLHKLNDQVQHSSLSNVG